MTEVATRTEQKVPVALAGPLAGLDEAYRMAQALAQSALMPPALRNKPSDVLVTILYGRELNVGPMAAAQVIHVISGRPFISGQLWAAMIRRAGHKLRVTGDDKSATATIIRADDDEPHEETFTLEDAKRAGLLGKTDSNWSKYPSRMLRWRAIANAARLACPEVALGFSVEGEEPDVAPHRPTLAQVAQEREQAVDTTTGEVHDAEVVDDDTIARQVADIEKRHTPDPAPLWINNDPDPCVVCAAAPGAEHDPEVHEAAGV